jgi:hypothetical protein
MKSEKAANCSLSFIMIVSPCEHQSSERASSDSDSCQLSADVPSSRVAKHSTERITCLIEALKICPSAP